MRGKHVHVGPPCAPVAAQCGGRQAVSGRVGAVMTCALRAPCARSSNRTIPDGTGWTRRGTARNAMTRLHLRCVGCENQPPTGVQIATNPRESEGGIDAGKAGGGEPPRRMSGGRCARSRRQSCAARCRRRRHQRQHEYPHLCGHECRARCAARCTAKPAQAMHGVRRAMREARARHRCGGASVADEPCVTAAARHAAVSVASRRPSDSAERA